MIHLWNGTPMIAKCKKEEFARRSFEGLAPLTQEVQRIARPILGPRGFAGIDILAGWEAIVGEDLARGIQPEKLTFETDKRTGGTLHVKSAGGAFAMLFEHQRARVIERINTFFGYPAVAHIRIRQGSLHLSHQEQSQQRSLTVAEEAQLNARVATIDDSELREQAYRIGKELILKK